MRRIAAVIGISILSVNSTNVYAQLTRGVTFIGGNIGYSSLTEKSDYSNPPTQEYKRHNFSIAPSAGTFLSDNLAIGAAVGFSATKEVLPFSTPSSPLGVYTRTNKHDAVFVAPFLRYYYLPTETFGVYGQVSAGYSLGRLRRTVNPPINTPSASEYKENEHTVSASITPALVFFPINKLGLELTCGSIGYNRSKRVQPDAPVDLEDKGYIISRFGANFGLNSLTLGAAYYLGR